LDDAVPTITDVENDEVRLGAVARAESEPARLRHALASFALEALTPA
jgi:hypothetical protein